MGKHLSYAGRLELIRSILFGMVQFWLNIFPMPDIVINQITCICRNFLWTGNTARSKFALVAWKHICLLKKWGMPWALWHEGKEQLFYCKAAMEYSFKNWLDLD
jgi:hypothetical protein